MTVMAETENTRLAERLSSIVTALRGDPTPPASTNGNAEIIQKSNEEIAVAVAFLERSEGGRQVLTYLRSLRRQLNDFPDWFVTDIAKGMAPALREFVAEALAPLEKRNAALEARLLQLEQAPTMKYCGV